MALVRIMLSIYLLLGLCLDQNKASILQRTRSEKKTAYARSNITKLVCGRNEEVNPCPLECDYEECPTSNEVVKSCTKRNCPPPACRCIFNYRRADNGTCIPTTECPPFPCHQLHEEYQPCPPYCPTDDCSQASREGIFCPFPGFFMTVFCSPQCRCKKGYWRRHGRCMPYEDCLLVEMSENFTG